MSARQDFNPSMALKMQTKTVSQTVRRRSMMSVTLTLRKETPMEIAD